MIVGRDSHRRRCSAAETRAAQQAGEPAAETVAQRAGDELADGVSQAEDEYQLRQVEIAVMAGAGHHRHDDAEVFPAEIIGSVEHPGRREDTETPLATSASAAPVRRFRWQRGFAMSGRFHGRQAQITVPQSVLAHVLNG